VSKYDINEVVEVFTNLTTEKSKRINSLSGKTQTIQMKMVKEIWNYDIKLETIIDIYASKKNDSYTTLPDEMSNWKPFADETRYQLFKEYSYSKDRNSNDKELSDEKLKKIITGRGVNVVDLTGTKYPTWEESVNAILANKNPSDMIKRNITRKKEVAKKPIENSLEQNWLDHKIEKIKKHPFYTSIFVIGSIIIFVGSVIYGFDNILSLIKEIFK